MEHMKKYGRAVLNIVLPLLALYLIWVWGPKLIRFFLPFVIGWVIAMIANPLVRFLEKRMKIVRKHSSVVIVVTVLALVILALYFIVVKLVSQAGALAEDIPRYYEAVFAEIQKFLVWLDEKAQFLPSGVQVSINQFFYNINDYLSTVVKKIAPPTVIVAGNVVKSIPAALFYVIVTVFSSYLFIVDREKVMGALKPYVPESGNRYYRYLKEDVKHLIGVYFLAQFKIMFVIALVLAAGFLVLGVDYALLLAAAIALLDFLPVFGAGAVLLPWAFIRLVSGEYAFAFGLFIIYVLTLVLRQIIQPKIVGDTMGLSPLMTLFLLYLGFKLSGIAGMILAVPVGMLVIRFYQLGAFDSFVNGVKLLVKDLGDFL